VIALSLCAPVILGLPFLTHNNIVIDHSSHTVIDKVSGFNLLNPKAPPPPPKQKLKDFFTELTANHKLMVAELNMVCAERKNLLANKFETVTPVDHVAAIRC
jgi:hypothetical protein